MSHFSKSDKWKGSKIRGNYPVGKREEVSQSVSQSVRENAHNRPKSRISAEYNFFSKTNFDMRSSTTFSCMAEILPNTKFGSFQKAGSF